MTIWPNWLRFGGGVPGEDNDTDPRGEDGGGGGNDASIASQPDPHGDDEDGGGGGGDDDASIASPPDPHGEDDGDDDDSSFAPDGDDDDDESLAVDTNDGISEEASNGNFAESGSGAGSALVAAGSGATVLAGRAPKHDSSSGAAESPDAAGGGGRRKRRKTSPRAVPPILNIVRPPRMNMRPWKCFTPREWCKVGRYEYLMAERYTEMKNAVLEGVKEGPVPTHDDFKEKVKQYVDTHEHLGDAQFWWMCRVKQQARCGDKQAEYWKLKSEQLAEQLAGPPVAAAGGAAGVSSEQLNPSVLAHNQKLSEMCDLLPGDGYAKAYIRVDRVCGSEEGAKMRGWYCVRKVRDTEAGQNNPGSVETTWIEPTRQLRFPTRPNAETYIKLLKRWKAANPGVSEREGARAVQVQMTTKYAPGNSHMMDREVTKQQIWH